MATLYITEYSGQHLRYHMQAAQEPMLLDQAVALSNTTAASSAPFGSQTHLVRLCTDTSCCIAFNSTATTANKLLPANVPEYFVVSPGMVLSAIES